MTTKYKIIAGFTAMVFTVIVLGFIGYRTASNASDDLREYHRVSNVDVMLSEVNTSVYKATHAEFLFRESLNADELDNAIREIEALGALYESMLPLMRSEQLIRQVQAARDLLPEYKTAYESLKKEYTAGYTAFQHVFLPRIEDVRNAINSIASTASAFNSVEALQTTSGLLDTIILVRTYTRLYASTLDAAYLKYADDALEQVEVEVSNLEALVPGGNASMLQLKTALTDCLASFVTIRSFGTAASGASLKTRKMNLATRTIMEGVKEAADKITLETGDGALARADGAKMQALAVSAAGLTIALGVAVFILISLSRVLSQLGACAQNIAQGNFDHVVQISEGGEIGKVADCIKAIPMALQGIMAEYRSLESRIESGDLNAQGCHDKHRGGFATLIKGSNSILSRFQTILENIPSPVVMLDKDFKVKYLNAVGREVAGDDYLGKTCSELFGREDYNSDACGLKRAAKTLQSAKAQTVAHPKSGEMDIAYTSIPMLTATGELISVLQLITDLTEVKRQAKRVERVAAEAGQIADRVAAASGQLASQIRYISDGAELQKQRMESTAGAMIEMTSTVMEVARNAYEASEQSEKTRTNAESGAELVNTVVSSMNSLNSMSLGLQENMVELDELAKNIGGIMDLISDVADQTNLLALNAAIEAARAGDAGRGFAVVADEVRKLAEKTMDATRKVGDGISAIQISATNNMREVASAAVSIAEVTDLADHSGEALMQIVSLAATTSQVFASIASAAEQQRVKSEEISDAVSDVNRVIGETSDGMAQSSAAIQDLFQMAQQLRTVMDEIT